MAGNGIVVNAAGGDALAFLTDRARSDRALRALRDSFASLGNNVTRVSRALARMGRELKGVVAALMETSTVAAGLDRGMANLYRWSKAGARDFVHVLDGLATDAQYLRNSLAAMAAPLLSAVAPAVNRVTNAFVDMFNVVNQVVSRLSGKDTYVAARRVDDAWDSVGGRISGAASALRRYIAGFDQLNVLYSGSKGASGGGGAGAAGMFETREIEGGLSDFVDALKAAVEAGDWEALGEALGEKVNEAVASVDWEALGEQVGGCLDGAIRTANAFLAQTDFLAIGRSIGALLAAAVARVDFTQLGQAVARLLLSAVQVGAGAAARFDWSAFGAKLAQGLNGFLGALDTGLDAIDWPALAGRMTAGLNRFIAGVDWKSAGSGLGRRLNDFIAVCRASVEGFDWAGAGRSLSDGLNSLLQTVDWAGLGRWLNRMLSGLLDFGISLVEGFDAEGFAAGLRAALEQVDWNSLARKLWALLRAALSKLGEAATTLLFGGTTDLNVAVSLLQLGWRTLKGWIEARSGGNAEEPVGLVRSGWSWVVSWVSQFLGGASVDQPVGLARSGWYWVSSWVSALMGNTAVDQLVGLSKLWASVSKWVSAFMGNTDVSQDVGLTKLWGSVSKWVSGKMGNTDVDQEVGLTKGWTDTPQKALGIDSLKTTVKVGLEIDKDKKEIKISGGMSKGSVSLATKALGGVFRHGIWSAIPQYAAGTLRAGSLFAAGEAGPELVGHIGGRTEVLNKSQLAATMFSAVSAGMLYALGKVRFSVPAMATGTVLPYEIAAQIARTGADIEDTLNSNNEDLIQTIIQVAGQIVAAMGSRGPTAAGGLTARQLIDQINRQTQMFGASPIVG